jgi:hypothetical protein
VVLDAAEQEVFAAAALSLKYEPDPVRPAPVTASQLLDVRRSADGGADLWSTFNRVQEALVSGGLRGRSANGQRIRTRPVQGIDANLKLNRRCGCWPNRCGSSRLRPGGASTPLAWSAWSRGAEGAAPGCAWRSRQAGRLGPPRVPRK